MPKGKQQGKQCSAPPASKGLRSFPTEPSQADGRLSQTEDRCDRSSIETPLRACSSSLAIPTSRFPRCRRCLTTANQSLRARSDCYKRPNGIAIPLASYRPLFSASGWEHEQERSLSSLKSDPGRSTEPNASPLLSYVLVSFQRHSFHVCQEQDRPVRSQPNPRPPRCRIRVAATQDWQKLSKNHANRRLGCSLWTCRRRCQAGTRLGVAIAHMK